MLASFLLVDLGSPRFEAILFSVLACISRVESYRLTPTSLRLARRRRHFQHAKTIETVFVRLCRRALRCSFFLLESFINDLEDPFGGSWTVDAAREACDELVGALDDAD